MAQTEDVPALQAAPRSSGTLTANLNQAPEGIRSACPDVLQSQLDDKHVAKSHAGSEFRHGAVSAICNILVTFPLNKAVSRISYEGAALTYRGAWRTLVHDAQHNGIRGLYKGVAPPLMQRSVSMGTMYGMYDFWFAQLQDAFLGGRYAGRLATDVVEPGAWTAKAGAAMLAGAFEALLTPFERIQTLLQHRQYSHMFANSWEAARVVIRAGPYECYRGFTAVLARNAPANAMFFTLRDPARGLLPEHPPTWMRTHAPLPHSRPPAAWSVARDFFAGAVLGSIISTLVYPVTTIKNVMQLDLNVRHRSIVEAYRQVVLDRGGLPGLFKGASGNAARALVSWGVTNSAYEIAKTYL